MRETIKKISITIILFLGLCLSSFSVNADPTVGTIVTNPTEPKPLSTFTVIATITGDNIISVNVSISECTEKPPNPQCYVPHSNIPMILNEDGKYQANVTLTGTQEDIDHVQYLFVINDNGTDYQFGALGELKTYLDLETDNGNNNEPDNGSPGFELIILLAAMFILLIFIKRKR